ncbi:MAG TPA: TetR/AcrR family transcriptional regulator [Chitinophagales bacterium]|nr:TetR/AcrR family transcriptional regulator [Chitinophagales bacterium]
MARISKQEWIRKGLKVLSEDGYHAIRIDLLCAKFRITKGSFYHHFNSLEDYERKLLRYWEKETLNGLTKVLEEVESPQGKINRMVQWAFSVSGTLELSLRAWALNNKLVEKLLISMELKRIKMVIDLYVEVGVPRKEARELAELGHAAWIGIQTCGVEGVVNREKSIRLINEMMKNLVKSLVTKKEK